MSIKLVSTGGGSVTIQEPNTASDFTLSVPSRTATVLADDGSGKVRKADLPSGSVIQVVNAIKTDTFSTTAGASNPTIITGLSASITPSSTSSKILILVNIGEISISADSTWAIFMYRNGTKINSGDSAGSRSTATIAGGIPGGGAEWRGNNASIMFVDTPSSTSSVTYTFALGGNSGVTLYINRDARDSNTANDAARTTSTVTLMEIAA